MNLLDKKLGLLLIVALTLFACEEELSTINVGPENNLGIFFGETSLADKVSQVWAGSSPSSFTGRALAGHYLDPSFGDIKATTYCDISIGFATYNAAKIETAELKSLKMSLRIAEVTGPYTALDIQKLELYKLALPIQDETEFRSSSTLALGEKVGEVEFSIHPDSLNLGYTTGQDSSLYDDSGLYIYKTTFDLTNEYKAEFLQAFINSVTLGTVDPSDSDDVDSVGYFIDSNLKGLAIVARDENNAIITYTLADSKNSVIDLDYTVENVAGNRTDATAIFIFNSFKSFSNIEPNENSPWSNSIFDNVTETNKLFETNDDQAYVQSGTNMFMSIDLSDFNNFSDSLNNPLIQKADLIIDNIVNSQSRITIPTSVGFYSTSIDSISNGSFSNIVISSLFPDLPAIINYNSDSSQYSVQIPLYTQSLVNKNTDLDHVIIGFNPLARDNNVNRFIVKKEDIKIRYYYSIPDKN